MWHKTFVAENGETFVDNKRGLWLLAIFIPMTSLVGPLLVMSGSAQWVLWLPIVVFYVLVPVLDKVIGEDRGNPPESVVTQLEADPYYRVITFLLVPLLIAGFIFNAWFVSAVPLSSMGWIAVMLSNGFMCGYGINLGHEMGHKTTVLERFAAKLVLSLSFYGHFNVEHNRGHHATVATPQDSASSKLGETIYGFFWREYPGAFKRAWQLEATRLQRRNQALWSWQNEVIQSTLITLVLYIGLTLWLGIEVLPFLLLTALWSSFQLTSANYIEHYGLARKRLPNGRYEPCRPQHSWNSNFLLSNWTLFHLQRHSDHHTYPMRRYQSLRHFDASPQLPAGYYSMFLLSYVPPLWFKVMDPLVMRHAEGDLAAMNIAPGKEAFYQAQLSAR